MSQTPSSKTQAARDLYQELRQKLDDKGNTATLHPGLYLVEDGWVWVAYGERAYAIDEMSDGHLANTIEALKERHPKELRKPLEDELSKREIA